MCRGLVGMAAGFCGGWIGLSEAALAAVVVGRSGKGWMMDSGGLRCRAGILQSALGLSLSFFS